MRYQALALLVSAVTLCSFSYLASAGDAKGEKGIVGAWTAVKGDQKIEIAFEAKEFTLSLMGKKITGTYKVDASKNPKQLDMTITGGSNDDEVQKFKGKTSLAIYELAGNKLKWLAPEPGGSERPTAFPQDGEKTKALYIIFDRAKK